MRPSTNAICTVAPRALPLLCLALGLAACDVRTPESKPAPEVTVPSPQPAPPPAPAATPPAVARLVAGAPAHRYMLPGAPADVADLRATAIGSRLRIDVSETNTVVAVPLEDAEAIWGFGQRLDAYDLRGRKFEVWATDGWNRMDSCYFAIPWFVSSRGYGLFINCTGRLQVDVGVTHPGELRIEIPEAGVEIWGLQGTPDRIVADYTRLVGRPVEVPEWTFRPWISRNSYLGAYEVDRTIALMETNGLKASAVVLEAWEENLHNFRFETNRYPNPAGWIRSLHERGYRVICWTTSSIWPVGTTYEEAKRRGFLVRNADGSEHVTRWLENGRKLDFRVPEARDFWRDLHLPLIEMGVDGFKTDGGEHMPDAWFHNEHPYHYQRATLDAFEKAGRPGIAFARSGNPLTAGNSTFWGGDQLAEWRNLGVVVRGGLSAAWSGLFYWSHDVGGYTGEPTKELYLRWLQIGAFSPMMQLHGVTAREPWTFDTETLRIARGYFQVREKLQPYLVELAREARERGHPMWRPLSWICPDDPATRGIGDQFMLGPDLLLAPILDERSERTVYLPAGAWVDLWNGQPLTGPTRMAVRAELAVIPAYARADAYPRWRDLLDAVPHGPRSPLHVDLAGARNDRGIVPNQRYLRGQRYEKLFYTVRNHTAAPAHGEARPRMPPGFQVEPAQIAFTAPPDGETRLAFYVTPPAQLPPGSYPVSTECRVDTRVALAPPVTLVQPPAWHVIGHFPGGVGTRQTLDGQTPDLSLAQPRAGGEPVRWQKVPADGIDANGYLDLDRLLGSAGGTTCFAYTRLNLASALRVRLYAGCGDSMTVWVNGSEVLQRIAHRNPDRDEDMVDVTLRAGANDILVRISRGIGANGMFFRIE
jgi:hypothetical protein